MESFSLDHTQFLEIFSILLENLLTLQHSLESRYHHRRLLKRLQVCQAVNWHAHLLLRPQFLRMSEDAMSDPTGSCLQSF